MNVMLKKHLLVAALLVIITASCGKRNVAQQKKEVPPHIAKEMAYAEKQLAERSAQNAAKKAAVYSTIRKEIALLQNKVSKRQD